MKSILLEKKKNDKILICEDDITFHDKSISIWNLALKELPEDWDILLGGISNFDYGFLNDKKQKYYNLVKIKDFSWRTYDVGK